MLDIKLVRSNPELVKENIKKKFQDEMTAEELMKKDTHNIIAQEFRIIVIRLIAGLEKKA